MRRPRITWPLRTQQHEPVRQAEYGEHGPAEAREAAVCGALPPAGQQPEDGRVWGCALPPRHAGRHVAPAQAPGGPLVPEGWTWPAAR